MGQTPRKDGCPLPKPGEAFQPWEWAGKGRRDAAQHRAGLLALLAYLSLLAGGLSFPCPAFGLVGLALGLLAERAGRRDLDAMAAGEMDPEGYRRTEKARADGQAGLVLSLLVLFGWLTLAAGVLLLACGR